MAFEFTDRIKKLTYDAEEALAERFAETDEISLANTAKVLDAFREHRVSDAMFAPSSGYGYDDRGRDTLEAVWAEVFGAEAALVRHSIVNGTHALTIALFGLLRPGDTMLSVTGKPYDTLEGVIGIGAAGEKLKGCGSLADFGVKYRELPIGADFESVLREDPTVKMVYLQRSKGYSDRVTLSADEISAVTAKVRAISPDIFVVVDNCYGEFTDLREPAADLVVGSLIKNPGGGIAESGGYLAGTKRAVELASYRMTTVGAGAEVGASLGQTKNMYKGLFLAPHVTAAAVRTALLAAYIFEALGFECSPRWTEKRQDIIQAVHMKTPEGLCAFCRGIQSASPVDSFVTPEPWAMPGYDDEVIMAAGAFTQGSSIELSADGPLRPPYTAFLQGGLTYEAGKLGVMSAADYVLRELNM